MADVHDDCARCAGVEGRYMPIEPTAMRSFVLIIRHRRLRQKALEGNQTNAA
jgi:hypothetical protein